ncbi:MAG: preprotein translocase subunit SecG [Gammaproteobacteria bacterium]|nr:preprotein translocase subunit SecG [Gammaproteobacteria bacterium]
MLGTIILVIHVFLALSLIGLVLLQQGKGADAGAAFGSGASATVFGARGSASFLSRTTGVIATLFFATSLSLAYLSRHQTPTGGSLLDQPQPPAPVTTEEQTAPGFEEDAIPGDLDTDLPPVAEPMEEEDGGEQADGGEN